MCYKVLQLKEDCRGFNTKKVESIVMMGFIVTYDYRLLLPHLSIMGPGCREKFYFT